jgi:hypothetical protein
MKNCEDCEEYRACRQEDGSLGDCQEPILSEEIAGLKRDNNVSYTIVAIVMMILIYSNWM